AIHALPGSPVRHRLRGSLATGNSHQSNGSLSLHDLPGSGIQAKHRILVALLAKDVVADQLINPVADLRLAVLAEQAVGAELVMTALVNVLRLLAPQDADHMVDAK